MLIGRVPTPFKHNFWSQNSWSELVFGSALVVGFGREETPCIFHSCPIRAYTVTWGLHIDEIHRGTYPSSHSHTQLTHTLSYLHTCACVHTHTNILTHVHICNIRLHQDFHTYSSMYHHTYNNFLTSYEILEGRHEGCNHMYLLTRLQGFESITINYLWCRITTSQIMMPKLLQDIAHQVSINY